MNILIVNGSPSGEHSITLQTVLYLQKLFPEHVYEILHAGQKIRKMEKDFAPCEEALKRADLILFCYPVYTFLVPSQLHRFIELTKESGIDLNGKYASQITTSKHFYDITAHAFINDNCADMGMKILRGLSADMDDLLHAKGQKEAEDWFRFALWSMEHGIYETAVRPESTAVRVPASEAESTEKKGGRFAVITDYDENDPASEDLQAMIRRFSARAHREVTVVNLRTFPFAGGCLGCFNCAADGKCIYKDGFDSFLREKIQTADAIVYAYTIKDHSMGYRFKLYDDRQFCNGHRTVTMGMPQGYLVDGDLSAESNLMTLMEARAQVGGNYLCGIASDTADTDRQIDALADTLEYAVMHHYTQPANFYGVGGMKIFRDLIWQMQGLMQEDHRFYKKHGFYDFPQKKLPMMLGMYAVGSMMRSPKIKKKLNGKMTEGMMLPYKKIVEKAGK